ncbi:hypothetical protein [Mycobacteroides abscessus]|uniref:hypothetical protein n=1 Tax=Mycobacteroides abscessus TaxID=36809 RepID=UPI00026837B4|nr:hypothetical protein [Mycobacteroides abscessus]EIT89480.1 hypothetical protein MA4S0303_3278 [Mycobacteroides abscessus 4S-0303]EIT91472.1 hypothetical protein MA4S0726RB_2801 [Mycobacteroides abscessus 4S-0726-RB]EIT95022.1 hypothetical protein MA4S0726RA_3212 [Mycobacteroides abscessus 4S-0726-RA]EIV07134.1 hypothetical protein MA4S0206_3295 [Mycobacteroides abscessus 4S-0206]EIV47235.1 hypothetical protein MA4S0116R_3252 [Mycobacteroides abscessus 4S-0116-R]
MSAITWDSGAGFLKGTVEGQWRYANAGGFVWYREDDQGGWCPIGLEHPNGQAHAEAHWAGLQDQRVVDAITTIRDASALLAASSGPIRLESDEAAKLYAAIDALPPSPVAPPPTRRTLWINGVVLTGEVQSISTHTHGDGTQSIEFSFRPDSADDTVRVIESMRVDR